MCVALVISYKEMSIEIFFRVIEVCVWFKQNIYLSKTALKLTKISETDTSLTIWLLLGNKTAEN